MIPATPVVPATAASADAPALPPASPGAPLQRVGAATEELQVLLGEVSVLANQLRKTGDEAESASLGGQSILKVLGSDGALTVPEIARVRSTSRQNIQILVNRLEAEGSVELARNPAHLRSSLVRITDRGRAVLAAARREETESCARMLPHLADADLAAAAAVLRRIRYLLADGDEAPCPARPERRVATPPTRAVISQAPAAKSEEPLPPVAPAPKPPKPAPEEEFPLNLL